MSRRTLLAAAHLLRLPTRTHHDGRRGSHDNQRLRTDILTRCYGPGHAFTYASPDEADRACLTAARTHAGEFGKPLRDAQQAIRDGMRHLENYRALLHRVPREPDAEAHALKRARQYFERIRSLHDQQEAAHAT